MGVPKAAADYTQGTDWEWRLPQLLWRGMLVDSNSLDSTRKRDGPGNLDCSWHPSATNLEEHVFGPYYITLVSGIHLRFIGFALVDDMYLLQLLNGTAHCRKQGLCYRRRPTNGRKHWQLLQVLVSLIRLHGL
jgi:hypothetical protein